MINNRQNGRRRGRGGGPRSPNNAPNSGNRQDNRSRGNASQLHEKYKAMARDAQLAGDRVQTETYLQFADHYFRVLNENRPRFEEQRRPRDDYQSDEDDDRDEGMNAGESDDREEREERPEREPRAAREKRNGDEPRPKRPRVRRDREDEGPSDGDERISADIEAVWRILARFGLAEALKASQRDWHECCKLSAAGATRRRSA